MATQNYPNTRYSIVGQDDKDWPQILTICIACLSSFGYALIAAWTSPFIVKITKDKEHYNINEDEASHFTTIAPVTMMITSIIFTKLNDIIGRKRTLIIVAIPQLTFWILTLVAKDVTVFYVARFFGGLGDAIFYASLPIYIGEISTPKVRGTWGSSIMISVYIGQFLINLIGSYFNVHQTAYICMFIPLTFFMLMVFMPESPYFEIMRGRETEAKRSLRFLRGKDNVEEDYIKLKSDVDRQISERGSWVDLVKNNANRKAFIAGLFLRVSQTLTGLMTFNAFTMYIFKESGSKISSEMSSMAFTGLMFILTLCVSFTIEKFGRKKCYIWSILACGVTLFLLSIYFYLDQKTNIDVKHLHWIPLSGMLLYIIASSFGVATIPTLMLSELFSASIKAKAISVLTVAMGLGTYFTNQLFYILNSNLGLYMPFLFFATCCFISGFLGILNLPETKGKTLEEIQQSLMGNKN